MAREIRLRIEPERCRACRRCLAARVCKGQAIVKVDWDEPPYLDPTRCYDCRRCLPVCPAGAIVASQAGPDMARASDRR